MRLESSSAWGMVISKPGNKTIIGAMKMAKRTRANIRKCWQWTFPRGFFLASLAVLFIQSDFAFPRTLEAGILDCLVADKPTVAIGGAASLGAR